MKTFFLLLFAALTLSAGATADTSAFFALGAGAHKHLMVDAGFALVRSGAAAWGSEVGYVGLNDQDMNSKPIAPGEVRETDFGALQFGAWADWGRGWAAVGAERVTQSTTTGYQAATHYGYVTDNQTSSTTKYGVYVKLGYHVSEHISIYVSAGSSSKVLAGLGVHF